MQFIKSTSVGAAALKSKKMLFPISSYFGHLPVLVNPQAHSETLLDQSGHYPSWTSEQA